MLSMRGMVDGMVGGWIDSSMMGMVDGMVGGWVVQARWKWWVGG